MTSPSVHVHICVRVSLRKCSFDDTELYIVELFIYHTQVSLLRVSLAMPGILIRVRTQLGTWKLKDVMLRDTVDDIKRRLRSTQIYEHLKIDLKCDAV